MTGQEAKVLGSFMGSVMAQAREVNRSTSSQGSFIDSDGHRTIPAIDIEKFNNPESISKMIGNITVHEFKPDDNSNEDEYQRLGLRPSMRKAIEQNKEKNEEVSMKEFLEKQAKQSNDILKSQEAIASALTDLASAFKSLVAQKEDEKRVKSK